MRSLLFCMSALVLNATIVDRVAVTVGNQVITDSEIDQRIRLTAFENGAKPGFDTEARRKTADRLIDEKLIEHEMDVGHYPRLGLEERASLLSDAKPNLDSALASYGLTRAELEADLAKQKDLVTFVSVRFRPAVEVTDQDVRQYFEKTVQPNIPAGAATGIEGFRAQIEAKLAGDLADRDMDAWLKDQRRRTRIQYLEKELAP